MIPRFVLVGVLLAGPVAAEPHNPLAGPVVAERLTLDDGPIAAAPLTLDAALARAEEVSVAVQLQELSSEAAEARWLADPRAGAPSLRIGARDIYAATALEPHPDPPEVAARLRFPLPRPWELHSAARQGQATVAREDAELASIRNRVRLAVVRGFHALPLLRDAAAKAERLVELRREHRVVVEQRRIEGLATALDWLDSEEERRDADDLRAAWLARAEGAEAELRLRLQWPAEQALELAPEDLSRWADAAPTAEDSSEPSPEVQEAEAEVDRAEARLRRGRLRSLPWLDWVQGGAVFRPDGRVGFDVGVAIDLPIYMGSPARTRAAAQELSSAELQLDAVRRSTQQRRDRRRRLAAAARQRWVVETVHLASINEHAEPLMELADPVLHIELSARVVRAELRVLSAFAKLVDERDRAEAAAQ